MSNNVAVSPSATNDASSKKVAGMSRLQQHYSKSRSLDEKVVLKWNNLSFSMREKDVKQSKFLSPVFKEKNILKSLNGSARSGQLLAIMGPTGCGKTSLLNVLAARVPGGGKANAKLSGSITINGVPRDDEQFRRLSAYVLQDDKLYPHLTVFETILLAAHFYMGDDVPMADKETLVTDVISELGLTKTRNTIIGDEKIRGVSGGERKRANVAVQLISDPAVLFLDEPTSGLDSFQAQAVMESMKAMAENGRLVISVIHQPRSSIYDMFDQILLLSEGRTMYLGSASGATSYFATLGFPCPKLFNPSDYFLDILSPDNRTAEAEVLTGKRIEAFGDSWEEYASVEGGNDTTLDTNLKPVTPITHPWTLTRFLRNFSILCWRAWMEQSREIPTLIIKVSLTIFFACIIGGIYSNSGYDQKGISNRIGILFVIAINQGFNGALGVLNTFPKEKVIVNRERATGAYDTLSYFTAKYMVELPINLVPCIIFACIIYYLVGLNPHHFGYHLLILMLEVLTAISLGLWISAATPTIEAANALGAPAVIIPLLFAGYYINVDSLPIVANWVPYISFIKWSFESLAINEFKGETFSCGGGSTSACLSTGAEVLNSLSFSGDTIYNSTFGMGMVFLGFTICAILSLHNSRLTYINLGHVGKNRK